MMKSVLAAVGLVAIVGGIAVWQFGFFSEKTREIKTQMERATASARVEKSISDLKRDISELDEKARSYNVKARKLEYAWERDQEQVDQIKEAIDKLCASAKEQGLPKPSESLQLTDEQKAVSLSFNGKTIEGAEVYSILEKWVDSLKLKEKTANEKKETIDRMREVSAQIVEKKDQMALELAKMEARVSELEGAKDLAEINAELATMEADVKGIAAGKSGTALATIQDQIDELNAIADSYEEEAQAKDDELNPSDVVSPENYSAELDSYWN